MAQLTIPYAAKLLFQEVCPSAHEAFHAYSPHSAVDGHECGTPLSTR